MKIFTLFPGPKVQKKGAELAGLAEPRIIISGVGLAVESHGEEGRSAVISLFK